MFGGDRSAGEAGKEVRSCDDFCADCFCRSPVDSSIVSADRVIPHLSKLTAALS